MQPAAMLRASAVCAVALWAVPAAARPQAPPNTLTAAERAAGWRLLFDGTTTAGWRGFRMDSLPAGWRAVDGALTRVAEAGDIVTKEKFKNFDLTLEWNISSGGNSGIFIRASEDDDAIYWTAPEMQVLDDARHPNGQLLIESAGAVFDLYPVPRHIARPPGQWNQVRILVNGTYVEQWLNGIRVAAYDFGNADWERRVQHSKFAPHPHFGKNAEGYIGLQDHESWVAFRNIKIRVVP
jgi:alpha-3'-ketoglucosidase